MAGHSKFKNIMHRKGAQDKKRAKTFSRLGKEIAVAVKTGGADPESNIRLRSASRYRGLVKRSRSMGILIRKTRSAKSAYEESLTLSAEECKRICWQCLPPRLLGFRIPSASWKLLWMLDV